MGKMDSEGMSFLDHLEELRWHIIRAVIAVLILAIAAFVSKSFVFDVIVLGPSRSGFLTNRLLCDLGAMFNINALCINKDEIKIQNISMAGQFMSHIKISIIGGILAAFPYVFYEFWRFVRPALYQNEKKVTIGAVTIISILFFMGVLFGYYVICPLSVNFLYSYTVSDVAENNIKLMSYVSTVASISLSTGLMFELPVLVYFFTKIGLLTPSFLRKYRKHALIIILLLSAIITPPDMFSQVLVSFPLLLLYELSIIVSRKIIKKNTDLATSP